MPRTPKPIDHGTYGGYQQHLKREPEVRPVQCAECLAAVAKYQHDYREGNPDAARTYRAKQSARDRAMRKLAKRFPVEFDELLKIEMKEEVT